MSNDETILDATKSGGLIQVNMQNMKDQISDQIRAFLLNAMPKEAFSQVIDTAWDSLTKPRPHLDYRGFPDKSKPAKPSELEEMVTKVMRQEIRKRVSEWGEQWRQSEDCELGAKTVLKDLVDQAAGSFIQQVSVGIVRQTASALVNAASAPTTTCGSCSRTAVDGAQCSCGYWN